MWKTPVRIAGALTLRMQVRLATENAMAYFPFPFNASQLY
jgi:hypothetical protein